MLRLLGKQLTHAMLSLLLTYAREVDAIGLKLLLERGICELRVQLRRERWIGLLEPLELCERHDCEIPVLGCHNRHVPRTARE